MSKTHADFSTQVVGNDPAEMEKAIDDRTRAVYIETISNPKHSVPDITAISDVAHKHGIPLIIDNTFGMGGFVSRPITLGVSAKDIKPLWSP